MSDVTKFSAVGRRKEAVARIHLFPGTGKVTVNSCSGDDYFNRETDKIIVRQPFAATNTLNKYDVIANVRGGGLTGQAGAVRLGIARALVLAHPDVKEILRKQGFLTRDPRAKERKKYGLKGARKRFQWTKR